MKDHVPGRAAGRAYIDPKHALALRKPGWNQRDVLIERDRVPGQIGMLLGLKCRFRKNLDLVSAQCDLTRALAEQVVSDNSGNGRISEQCAEHVDIGGNESRIGECGGTDPHGRGFYHFGHGIAQDRHEELFTQDVKSERLGQLSIDECAAGPRVEYKRARDAVSE